MGFPPQTFSENISPIPPGASPHRGPPGQARSLGYGGRTADSESIERISGETARFFSALLGRIQGVATSLMWKLDDAAPSTELHAIVQACYQGAEVAQKLGVIGLRESGRPSVLDLADFIRGLGMGTTIPEEILYCEEFPEIPCRVRVDPGQMEQVLQALVSNAVEALKNADRGTPAVIWVGMERIGGMLGDGERTVGWIHLQVADNGCGMGPSTASRAFAPFFTTRKTPMRLGLGLAVAEGLVHRAGGAITLESAPAWGTRVNVWLPISPD